jgi:hypothetical protein
MAETPHRRPDRTFTVELRTTDKDGNEIFRHIFDRQPCDKYEVEIEGLATFSARVTEWRLVDGQYLPIDPAVTDGVSGGTDRSL